MLFIAFCLVAIFGFILYENVTSVRVASMKSLALTQARLIASNTQLREAVETENTLMIKHLMRNYEAPANIDYVSVANVDQIRLYHSKGRGVGVRFVDASLENKSLIKARVPIFTDDQFIGIVSVGVDYDEAINNVYQRFIFAMGLAVLVMALLALTSRRFVHYLANNMQHQSPKQIEMALKLRQGILNTVFEGVIAVDKDNHILVINDSALKFLHILDGRDKVHGSDISDYIYPTDFFSISNQEEISDKAIVCNGETIVANRKYMLDSKGERSGVVISFRLNTEISELEQTINAVNNDKENLRAIIHEFNNQIAIIYGLLQMEKYEKARDFIQAEHQSKQSDIYHVSKTLRIPTLVALVLSKISRAKELGITLEVDPLSAIHSDNLPISEAKITCIIGNLINNAFEAIVKAQPSTRIVRLYIHHANELLIEVEDSGNGIRPEDIDKIFERSYTAKQGKNRGIGLNLIRQIVTNENGTIIVEESELGGALFNLYIPDNIHTTPVSKPVETQREVIENHQLV